MPSGEFHVMGREDAIMINDGKGREPAKVNCAYCTQCHHHNALKVVLADRERELWDLKGPCSNKECRLHYAHSGPCAPQTV